MPTLLDAIATEMVEAAQRATSLQAVLAIEREAFGKSRLALPDDQAALVREAVEEAKARLRMSA